jgi:hypothetical protein
MADLITMLQAAAGQLAASTKSPAVCGLTLLTLRI